MKIVISASILWGLLAIVPFTLGGVCYFKDSRNLALVLSLLLSSLYSLLALFCFIKAIQLIRNTPSPIYYVPSFSRKVFRFWLLKVVAGFSLACWTFTIETQSEFEKFSVIYSLIILSIANMYNATLWILSFPFYLTLCIFIEYTRKKIASISTIIAFVAMFVHALAFTIFEEPLYNVCDKIQVKNFSSTSGITVIFILGCFVFWIKNATKTPNDIFFSSFHPTHSMRYNLCRRLVKYFFVCFLSSGVFLPGTVIFLSRYAKTDGCKAFMGVTFIEFVATLWISLFSVGMMVHLVLKYRRDLRRYQEAVLAQQQVEGQYYEELEKGLTSVLYQKVNSKLNTSDGATQGSFIVRQSFSNVKLEDEEDESALHQKLLVSEEDRCPICWVNFEEGKSLVIYVKPCNHVFHGTCIRSWVRRQHESCPYCRAQIQSSNSNV